jgi:hypothetical protein
VLSSLESLGMGDAGITEWFGRPDRAGRDRAAGRAGPEAIGPAAPGPRLTALSAPLKPTTEQVPDDDVSDDDVSDDDREATLAALLELYGGDPDALDAAAQDDYGKPLALIGQRRLSEMLTREQAGASS